MLVRLACASAVACVIWKILEGDLVGHLERKAKARLHMGAQSLDPLMKT